MEDNKNIQNKTEAFLSDIGMTLPQLFQYLGKSKSSLLNLDDASQEKFIEIYDKIDQNNCDKSNKGKLLEDLVALLFQGESGKLFNTRRNCRTSTNEIDLLLEWTDEARMLGLNTMYPCLNDSFICECKNYDGRVGVTFVGKFCSLLDVTDTLLGVMVTWDGITGQGKWDGSKGLVKKVALKQKKYVVVLDKDDLRGIRNKETNIFSLIHGKYVALKDDIDYTKYIQAHEAEATFKI